MRGYTWRVLSSEAEEAAGRWRAEASLVQPFCLSLKMWDFEWCGFYLKRYIQCVFREEI